MDAATQIDAYKREISSIAKKLELLGAIELAKGLKNLIWETPDVPTPRPLEIGDRVWVQAYGRECVGTVTKITKDRVHIRKVGTWGTSRRTLRFKPSSLVRDN